jgi:hypothetical protein
MAEGKPVAQPAVPVEAKKSSEEKAPAVNGDKEKEEKKEGDDMEAS